MDGRDDQAEGLRGGGGPLGGFGFRLLGGFGLAGVGLGELAAEALDAACGVDQLLLAGEEGVAGGADFENDVALVRGAGGEAVAAGALDRDFVVLRMNSLFRHGDFPFLARICSVSGLFRVADRLRTVWSRHIEWPVA